MNGSVMTMADVVKVLETWWKTFGFIDLRADDDGVCVTIVFYAREDISREIRFDQDGNGLWHRHTRAGVTFSRAITETAEELNG